MVKKQHKKLCKHGHDISIVGRNKYGMCNGCRKPVSLGIRLPKKKVKKSKPQFCKHGHNTLICGRDKQGHCKDCLKTWREKNKIRKQVYDREYHTKHNKLPKVRKCKKKYNRKYYKENKNVIIAQVIEYQKTEKSKAYHREYAREIRNKTPEWIAY